jgi:hypothetical protein
MCLPCDCGIHSLVAECVSWNLQGRKRAREGVTGAATVTGGVSLAAATAAAQAAGAKQQKVENFYRFQQRDKRRNGEDCVLAVASILKAARGLHAACRRVGCNVRWCVQWPDCEIIGLQVCTTMVMLATTLPAEGQMLTCCCNARPGCWCAELLELRQRFEEDRKRLAALKAARNFKPS